MKKILTLLTVCSVTLLSSVSAQEGADELAKTRKDRERLIDLALTLEADFSRTLQDYRNLQKDYAKLAKKNAAPDQTAKIRNLENQLKQALTKIANQKPAKQDARTRALLEQDMVNLRNELHRQRQDLLVARARLIRVKELERNNQDLEKKLKEAPANRAKTTRDLKAARDEKTKLMGKLEASMVKLQKTEKNYQDALKKITVLETKNAALTKIVKEQEAELTRLRPLEAQHKKTLETVTALKKEQVRLSALLAEREKQLANLKSHLAAEVKRSLEIPILIQAKSELEKKLAASNTATENLKKQNETTTQKKAELEMQIKDVEKTITSMRTQLEKNKAAMNSANKLKVTNDKLLAEQALLNNTVRMAKAELVKAMGVRNRLEAELAESEKFQDLAKKYEAKNTALLEEQGMIRDRLIATEKSFKILQADRDKLEAAYADLDQDKEQLTKEVTKRNDELQKLRSQMAGSTKSSEEATKLKAEKEKLEAELKKRENDLSQTRKELGRLQINATVLEKQLVSLKRTTATIAPVRYAKGGADVNKQQARVFADVQQTLSLFPKARFEIVGHTCDIGSAQNNLKLSRKRAKSLYDFLLSKGIKPERLKHRGVGQTEPAVPNTSEANRRQNRRVEVEILD